MASPLLSRITSPLAIGLLAIAALVTIVSCANRGGGVAEVPSYFDKELSLDDALAQAALEDKVVVAVTTADWCAPCQTYKRGTLVDSRVASWITTNAVPVYIDADLQKDAVQTLGVRGFPTTTILNEGRVIQQLEGNITADLLLSALSSAAES